MCVCAFMKIRTNSGGASPSTALFPDATAPTDPKGNPRRRPPAEAEHRGRHCPPWVQVASTAPHLCQLGLAGAKSLHSFLFQRHADYLPTLL